MKFKFLVLCLFIPCTTFGGIYKWVDDQGQTHYGERPTVQSSEKIVIPKRTITPKAQTTEKQRLENVKKWVNVRQQERETAKQEKAERKKKCDKLRRELKDIEQDGIAWYQLNEAGEREYYSDEEIDAGKSKMRGIIKKNCG